MSSKEGTYHTRGLFFVLDLKFSNFVFYKLFTLYFTHYILWKIQGGGAMIGRTAEDTLLRLASQFPVVGVTGPRQSGKSTLVQEVFPEKRYIGSIKAYFFFLTSPMGACEIF